MSTRARSCFICLDIPLWATILLIGVVTAIYDTIGGMKAVVYSDVIQMTVLLGGLVTCIAFAIGQAGGVGATLAAFSSDRWAAFDPGTGLGDGSPTPFWAFLVGGFFLYASYYGLDQSQVQRQLSAPTIGDAKRSLALNGLSRFPLTLLYLGLGVALAGAYAGSPELRASVPPDRLDALVPQFILQFLPAGMRALLFAAILAAAMSSLDSSINSLSAATVRDFISPDRSVGPRKLLRLGRLTTLAWGAAVTGFAFTVGSISATVIEAINKIGSAFYGPILAAFLLGIVTRRATATGVIAGVVAGVGFNLVLWIAAPGVHWMWWNAFGFGVAVAVALAVGAMGAPIDDEAGHHTLTLAGESRWRGLYGALVGWFVLILIVVLAAGGLAR